MFLCIGPQFREAPFKKMPTAFWLFTFVLYYTSQYFVCWDFVGMTIQDLKCVGIDPNSYHPKLQPTTPRNFFNSIHFQYQKQM